MNPKTIHALKRHQEKIMTQFSNVTALSRAAKSSVCYYDADYFLPNQAPLFMSFHDEDGNLQQHNHDFFELIYVVAGNPVTVIDSTPIHMSTGTLCLMNPNAIHYFESYKDHKDLILNLVLPKDTFKKRVLIPLIQDPQLKAFFTRYQVAATAGKSYIYLENPNQSAMALLDLMVEEYLTEAALNQTILDALMTLFFSYLFRDYQNLSHNNSIEAILIHIHQHFATCTLKDMAKHYGYHPKYLSALFKQTVGIPFRHFLTLVRLQNGANLLQYTDQTIENIAHTVGYEEKSSFYAAYKKHYNCSPSEYRRQHQNI